MHHHQPPEMKSCIDNCLACYRECLSTAMNHCLEMGGKHTEAAAFQAYDGMRRDLPNFGSFYAHRFRTP